jgi:selenium metabolism protein YedF
MQIEAKGRPCPQPVVLALHALEKCGTAETLSVLVDNEAAVENLKRMASQKGRAAAVQAGAGEWRVEIGPAAGTPCVTPEPASFSYAASPAGGAVVAVGTGTLGRGSDELGHILMKGFLYALAQLETPPKTVLFFNGGAKLTAAGSESLEDLKTLEGRGTEILTCGTCLDYYGIKAELAVGSVTNMYHIVETLTGPGKVVSL